jgi:hypothetical protein
LAKEDGWGHYFKTLLFISAKAGLWQSFSFTAHPQSAIMPEYEKKFITSAAA